MLDWISTVKDKLKLKAVLARGVPQATMDAISTPKASTLATTVTTASRLVTSTAAEVIASTAASSSYTVVSTPTCGSTSTSTSTTHPDSKLVVKLLQLQPPV